VKECHQPPKLQNAHLGSHQVHSLESALEVFADFCVNRLIEYR